MQEKLKGKFQHVMPSDAPRMFLAELSKILSGALPSDLKIQRAINLDGGSSSAFWFARKNGTVFSISEEKTVRDFVAVIPR